MPLLPKFLLKTLSLAGLTAVVASLGGCVLVTDTSRMNPDVFVQETAPVFAVAPYATPPTNQPAPLPGAIPQRRQLYPSHFHQTYRQTYGLPVSNPMHRIIYGATSDGDRTLPAVPYSRIDSRFLRQEVDYQTKEAPGTIVVDPHARLLYHVTEPGLAMRFGIAVGQEGRGFTGSAVVQRKEEYPYWAPTKNMIRQDPELYGPLAAGLR